MSFQAPTIEADGTIGHAQLNKRITKWKREKTSKDSAALIDPSGRKAVVTTVDFAPQYFELMGFGFKPDSGNRVASVEIYVNVQYLKDLDSVERYNKIQEMVQRLSPWFYTYGKREME
jgi:hypothetical protein